MTGIAASSAPGALTAAARIMRPSWVRRAPGQVAATSTIEIPTFRRPCGSDAQAAGLDVIVRKVGARTASSPRRDDQHDRRERKRQAEAPSATANDSFSCARAGRRTEAHHPGSGDGAGEACQDAQRAGDGGRDGGGEQGVGADGEVDVAAVVGASVMAARAARRPPRRSASPGRRTRASPPCPRRLLRVRAELAVGIVVSTSASAPQASWLSLE